MILTFLILQNPADKFKLSTHLTVHSIGLRPTLYFKISMPSMHGKTPLLRSTPVKHTMRKKTGFLSLPAEIRNRIYEYYFDSNDFRCEIAAKQASFDPPAPKPTIKLCVGIVKPNTTVVRPAQKPDNQVVENTVRISRRLGQRNQVVQREATKWATSLCPLILTCKLVHMETLPLLYRNTTFVFNVPKRFRWFFDTVPDKNVSYITKLELYYLPYHEPMMICKAKNFTKAHLAAWVGICRYAAKNLVNLQDLTIHIDASWPKRFFDLRQDIVKPFLQFRRLSPKDGSNGPTLKTVKVNFTSHWSRDGSFDNDPRLTEASKDLHRLYGEAIRKAILGATEVDAMAELVEAWEGKHALWRYHLGFLHTGW